MAATVSPWANKPGAWALDAEEHEAELLQQPEPTPEPLAKDFPSLSTAAATKQKKKKNQTLSLAEFSSIGSVKPAKQSPQPVGRTHEDLLMLPTGPRERSAEELDRSRLGGGFKNYGSNSRYGSGDESSNSRWGSSRVSDDSRRNRDSSREIAPSRADETDNWAAAKKSVVTGNGFERRERGERGERERGGFFDSQSKADESDSWVTNKSFTPSEGRRFGGGFERRGGFDSLSNGNGNGGGGGGGADSDNWGKKRIEESSGGGSGSGSGGMRPRLFLQPRTLPVAKEGGVVAKAKGSNPFGEARPREEVLAEKGKDLKEIEEKFEAVKVVKEEKVEGKRGFGRSWSDNKAERTWRKPDSDSPPPPAPLSAEKHENGHAENGHTENGHDDEEN